MSLTLKPRSAVRAKISALGTYVPPRVLTNADLEKMVETNDQWIVERTGIRERHLVDKGIATSDLSVEAARRCLASRGIQPTEVEAIIVATVTPDMIFPSAACVIQNKLGATGAWGFDLSAACSGFPYALQVGAKLVESGAHKKVLVIGADVMSSIIDYTDRSTCILFGDGAGAVLLEPCEEGEIGLIDFWHEIDGSGAVSLNMPAGGSLLPASHETVDKRQHFVYQDGQAVYKFAVRKMAEAAEKRARAQRRRSAPSSPASSPTRPTSASSSPPRNASACPWTASSLTSTATATPPPAPSRSPWTPPSKKAASRRATSSSSPRSAQASPSAPRFFAGRCNYFQDGLCGFGRGTAVFRVEHLFACH